MVWGNKRGMEARTYRLQQNPVSGLKGGGMWIFCRLFLLSALAMPALLYNKVITNHIKSEQLVRDLLFRDNPFNYRIKKRQAKFGFIINQNASRCQGFKVSNQACQHTSSPPQTDGDVIAIYR